MRRAEKFQEQIRKLKLTARRVIHRFGEGTFRTTFLGRGIEFAALREYVPGDDIRQIEWNTTARRGSPYVKTFMEERDLSIMLIVDLSSSMDIKNDSMLRIISILTCLAELHEDRIGCLGFTDRVEFYVPPAKTAVQAERILHLLMTRDVAIRKTSLATALQFLHRVLKKQALLFVVTDFLDRDFERPFLSVAQKHEVVGIYLYHPLERQLPRSAVIDSYDPESGKRILLDSYDSKTVESYARRTRAHKEYLRQTFAAAKADLLILPASKDTDVQLIQFLRRRQSTRAPLQLAV